MKRRFFISVLLAVCMLFSSIALSGCAAKILVDCSKCVSVSFSGFNGEGYASAVIDRDYIASLLGDKNQLTAAAVANSFSIDTFSIANNGKLSNGDVITVPVKVNEETLKNADVAAVNTEISVVVEGLKEKPRYDIFADVSVDIAGISPYCTVNVNYTGTPSLYNGSFVITNSEGNEQTYFKNGDKITVSLSESAVSTLERTGILEEKSREYTVKCDKAYILSSKDMSAAQKAELDKIAENFMNEQVEILRNHSDRTKHNLVVACASGWNIGALYATSSQITDIQNIKFNSAYVGIIQEKGAFGSTKEYKYAYYFYDMDVSYIIKDAFKDDTGTSSVLFAVRIIDPQIELSTGKISYSEIEMDCNSTFELARSKKGLDNLEKIS